MRNQLFASRAFDMVAQSSANPDERDAFFRLLLGDYGDYDVHVMKVIDYIAGLASNDSQQLRQWRLIEAFLVYNQEDIEISLLVLKKYIEGRAIRLDSVGLTSMAVPVLVALFSLVGWCKSQNLDSLSIERELRYFIYVPVEYVNRNSPNCGILLNAAIEPILTKYLQAYFGGDHVTRRVIFQEFYRFVGEENKELAGDSRDHTRFVRYLCHTTLNTLRIGDMTKAIADAPYSRNT